MPCNMALIISYHTSVSCRGSCICRAACLIRFLAPSISSPPTAHATSSATHAPTPHVSAPTHHVSWMPQTQSHVSHVETATMHVMCRISWHTIVRRIAMRRRVEGRMRYQPQQCRQQRRQVPMHCICICIHDSDHSNIRLIINWQQCFIQCWCVPLIRRFCCLLEHCIQHTTAIRCALFLWCHSSSSTLQLIQDLSFVVVFSSAHQRRKLTCSVHTRMVLACLSCEQTGGDHITKHHAISQTARYVEDHCVIEPLEMAISCIRVRFAPAACMRSRC